LSKYLSVVPCDSWMFVSGYLLSASDQASDGGRVIRSLYYIYIEDVLSSLSSQLS